MSRRGENITHRKDGRWEGRYIKGRKEDGKAQFGFIYGKSYGEVKARLLPLKLQYSSVASRRTYSGPFSGWMRYWLEDNRSSFKESTYVSYRRKVTLHILPALGDKDLGRMTGTDISRFITELANKGLSSSTINTIYCILSSAIKKAADDQVIASNICIGITLPKIAKKRVRALTNDEQKRLEHVARTDKYGDAIILALYTGLRIGELCALEWSNVDLKNGTIFIEKTMQRLTSFENNKKTKIVFGSPKSEASIRLITLPSHITQMLCEMKKQAQSEYVISCKGSFTEPRTLLYRLQRMAEKAGVRPLRFHALRHTYATRWIEMNLHVSTLSHNLGHASTRMTMDIYTDSLPEHETRAAAALDKLYEKNKLRLTV